MSDFKQVTSYRLNGAFAYDEIGPAGELKAGDVSEESFTNQVKTYGKMFSVTRQDIINDDLGALSALPTRIGRGAAGRGAVRPAGVRGPGPGARGPGGRDGRLGRAVCVCVCARVCACLCVCLYACVRER